jgi:2-oxoglutarate dehydrogenase E2 component (dihydrolipoamide succinyltransferase)
MSDIVVPELGESVLEARIARWLKKEGDRVALGDPLVELETEKVNLEVNADRAGVLASITRQEGEDVKIGDVLGSVDESATQSTPSGTEASTAPGAPASAATPPAAPVSAPAASSAPAPAIEVVPASETPAPVPAAAMPASAPPPPAAVAPAAVAPAAVAPAAVAPARPAPAPVPQPIPSPAPAPNASTTAPLPASPLTPRRSAGERTEKRERMSKRRATIARRLVEAQHNAAMLTTFNEIDMSAVMSLRERHKEAFKTRFGVGLGIASFFVKVSVAALHAFPQLNAEIQGDEIVLKQYYDIGIAVGAEGGLVVPVLRDADQMSFASVELAIRNFAKRAADGTLTLQDLTGGTFTITNGGVFGSLLSTPILNPPQVGILGLHKIQDRPTGVNGQVVLRPMMYAALSYDHRIVDGREAVQFLVKVKELIEDPAQLLLEG